LNAADIVVLERRRRKRGKLIKESNWRSSRKECADKLAFCSELLEGSCVCFY